MLLAVTAFLVQGADAIVARAGAAVGYIPQPAHMATGMLHFHGHISHVVDHDHDHGDEAGHVHDPANPLHPEDAGGDLLVWSVTGTAAILPLAVVVTIVRPATAKPQASLQARLTGVEPEGLCRPPSIPSIA